MTTERIIPAVALVTGANRGIGLEVVRQLARLGSTVLLGSRDLAKGEVAIRKLRREGVEAVPCQPDVTDEGSIERLRRRVAADYGTLDALVNNAAINYDADERAASVDLDFDIR